MDWNELLYDGQPKKYYDFYQENTRGYGVGGWVVD